MDYQWGPTGANGDPLVWWAGKNKEVLVAGHGAALGHTFSSPLKVWGKILNYPWK